MCCGLPTCEYNAFWLQLLGNKCFRGKPSLWSIFNVSLIATLLIDIFQYSSSTLSPISVKAFVHLTWFLHIVWMFSIKACELPLRAHHFFFFFRMCTNGWMGHCAASKSLHVLCVTLAEEQRHTVTYILFLIAPHSSNSCLHSLDAAENPPPSSEQAYF